MSIKDLQKVFEETSDNQTRQEALLPHIGKTLKFSGSQSQRTLYTTVQGKLLEVVRADNSTAVILSNAVGEFVFGFSDANGKVKPENIHRLTNEGGDSRFLQVVDDYRLVEEVA